MKYRKKPVVIEAVRAAELIEAGCRGRAREGWPAWFYDANERSDVMVHIDSIEVRTLEGVMVARPDDWIICGIKGELYPCKPDVFAATYEAVS